MFRVMREGKSPRGATAEGEKRHYPRVAESNKWENQDLLAE